MLKELIKEILKEELTAKTAVQLPKTNTFLEVGQAYAFRTITMIYTGKIKAICGDEVLIEDAAWIAETARWAQFCEDLSAKEVEPYCQDVILFKGSFLDVFKVDEKNLPREQK